jgi:hypothetical protein
VSEIACKNINHRAATRQALRWHLHQSTPLRHAARDAISLKRRRIDHQLSTAKTSYISNVMAWLVHDLAQKFKKNSLAN